MDLNLLAAMVATDSISFNQAQQWVEFSTHVDVQCIRPISLEAAVDLALGYFKDDPDVEAERQLERVQAVHDEDMCPDCGGPMSDGPDEADFDQALDLWAAVRAIADKYAFDRRDFSDNGREEC